jgi:hypothetical protein
LEESALFAVTFVPERFVAK